jgi:hypothetical protein
MSHAATNWAIQQKGLKPATKIVLWHLCDRHNPDLGCFPSLDRLAADCEMSRRSVQDHINILCRLNLVRVEKMPRKEGQLPRNRYILGFELGLGQNLPKAKTALGKSACEPWANSRASLGQNLPTNLVREPIREPARERATPPLVGGSLPREDDSERVNRSASMQQIVQELRAKAMNERGIK